MCHSSWFWNLNFFKLQCVRSFQILTYRCFVLVKQASHQPKKYFRMYLEICLWESKVWQTENYTKEYFYILILKDLLILCLYLQWCFCFSSDKSFSDSLVWPKEIQTLSVCAYLHLWKGSLNTCCLLPLLDNLKLCVVVRLECLTLPESAIDNELKRESSRSVSLERTCC